MKNVILDTNIILDIALDRRDFCEDAKDVLVMLNKKGIRSFVTATTITDIYYILKNLKDTNLQLPFLPDCSIMLILQE